MRVESQIVKIPKLNNLSVENVEFELTKLNITPLRWAIVHVDDKIFTISVANLME